MIKYDFSGQVALVTGGTRGIGAAVSSALLQAGANVIATYAGNRAAAEEFAAAQGDLRNRLELHCFDVSDYAAVETFFRQFDLKHDRLDILVNSAGIRQDAVVAMLPEEQWQRVLAVNLNGAFNMAKMSVLRMMRNRYGRIILLSSPIGRLGFAGQANYPLPKPAWKHCANLCAKKSPNARSLSIASLQALSTLTSSAICRRSKARSTSRWCRCGASAPPRKSPMRCSSWPLRKPSTSAAASWKYPAGYNLAAKPEIYLSLLQ